MFAIIYEKGNGTIRDVIGRDYDIKAIERAIPEYCSVIEVENVINADPYREMVVVENGKLVVKKKYISPEVEIEIQKRETQFKINEFKQMLKDTDYKAIKFAEGELTAEEYEPIRQQRKAWREEIRKLGG